MHKFPLCFLDVLEVMFEFIIIFIMIGETRITVIFGAHAPMLSN